MSEVLIRQYAAGACTVLKVGCADYKALLSLGVPARVLGVAMTTGKENDIFRSRDVIVWLGLSGGSISIIRPICSNVPTLERHLHYYPNQAQCTLAQEALARTKVLRAVQVSSCFLRQKKKYF